MKLATGIEKFIALVSHCSECDKVLEKLQQLRTTKTYSCLSAKVYALHLMLDLYSEDSGPQANVNRITTNLEAAAYDLLNLSRRIKERA